MRIFEQQYENGNSSYYISTPIYIPPKNGEAVDSTKKYFKKVYINFINCEASTGNLTPIEWSLGCRQKITERELRNKVTGEKFRADVSTNEIQLNIFKYEVTDKDKERNEEDKQQNRVYTKAPVTAEVIAKRKADSYARKQKEGETDTPLGDYISLDAEDLDEILPF